MNTKVIGDMGEEFACQWLMQNGYEIVSQNYRCQYGEIDVIAKKDDIIAFVEVKTRKFNCLGTPGEAVNKSKQRKIIITAISYLSLHETNLQPRFDVFEIFTDGNENFKAVKFQHIIDAFYAD